MINVAEFKNPGDVYRTAPFWGLNDKLEAEELKRQIGEFKAQGMGGAYLHPRGGMDTVYLSEDYWHAMDVCIKEMARLGMCAWLYDEDRFPSGIAGGKVVGKNPDYAAQFLSKDYEVKAAHMRDAYNFTPYVDVCNKEAIDEFVRITHDEYYARFKDYFGNTIPAMFTDEPNLTRNHESLLPWTKGFDKAFVTKYGYEIKDFFADLQEDTPTASRTRFHYWSLISEMFVTAFSKTCYDWCEEKGIAYTGHFWEHEFPDPALQGSVMPHYKYMQYPGIDMLFVSDPTHPEQYSNDLIVKEACSVANQFGRKRVLSETMGASGWALNFAYQKRATDWQLALGINLFCQHLSLYSMKGYRKRDFPLSFLDHQPWWGDYKMLADYIGRMSYALSQGAYMADVLVLHPSSSTWVVYNDKEKLAKVGDSVKQLVQELNQRRVMFDLGDDVIMAEDGCVNDGRLCIGEMSYKVVYVPEMYVMRKQVFELMKKFTRMGGTIICTGATPTLLDGEYSAELETFFSVLGKQELLDDVLQIRLEESNGKDLRQVYAHMRVDGTSMSVFICNLDMHERYEISMPIEQFGGNYAVTRFDGMTGEAAPAETAFTLEPLESVLFVLEETAVKPIPLPVVSSESTCTISLTNWRISIQNHNALNLQFARASLNGEPYGEITDILKIDDFYKDKLGLERGNIFVRQPWMYKQKERDNVHNVRVEYPFTIADKPVGAIYAAVELSEIFDVYINNVLVSANGEFYKDAAFHLHDISDYVKLGENVLRIESSEYGVLVCLENVYIVGDFRLESSAIHKPCPLAAGDIVPQGYQYYSGRVKYSADVEMDRDASALLIFGKFDGVTARVYVNDELVDTIAWQPHRVGVRLKAGKNTVAIEIANSLQNLLGPFGVASNQHLVTPGSFYADSHDVFFPSGFDCVAEVRILEGQL